MARVVPLTCALLLALPARALAQRLTGSVADAASGEPISLALVALVDTAGAVLQQVLTNDAGRFVMMPRAAGRVRLRIDRIGYATTDEPFFELAADTERHFTVVIRVQPITLEGITVTEQRICEINARASETLRVWTEARKALAAATIAERQRLFRFSGVTFRRDGMEDGATQELQTRPFMDSYRQPFRSRPAADLMEKGYVRQEADGTTFYGPNAEVLLSREFEQANCFSLTRDRSKPDLIGVRFAPNPRHPVSAISGTVWLEARTARLRFAEFAYVNARRIPYADLAGGRVEFQMLPNGGWIVSRWWIRMPKNVHVLDGRVRMHSFREDGGEVRTASSGNAEWSILAAGTIAGVAIDSTTGRPLIDADVKLAGTALAARTAADGSFRISNLPAGTYTLTLSHPRLDSVPPYAAQAPSVRVEGSDTTHVALAIPPLERSALAPCLAAMTPRSDRVAVYGTLRQANGEPVARARLRLSWDSVFRAAAQLQSQAHTLEIVTDERGRYIACDLPGGMTIVAELLAADESHVRLQFHTGDAGAGVAGHKVLLRPLVIPQSMQHPPVAASVRHGATML